MHKILFILIFFQSTNTIANIKDKNIFFSKQWSKAWSLKSFSKMTISPYIYTPSELKWQSLVLLSLFAGKNIISPKAQEYITKNRLIGAEGEKYGNKFGEKITIFLYSGSYYAHSYFFKSKNSFYKAQFYIETVLGSALFAEIAKILFNEQRPNGLGHKSFPSGHAATAFALAASASFTQPWYIATLANIAATGTAIARIQSNKHYLHDVLASVALSYSYAYATYQKYRGPKNKTSLQPDSIFFSLNKINLIWTF